MMSWSPPPLSWSPPPLSWSPRPLSCPIHIHIVLVLALALGYPLANAAECRHEAFVVDSSKLDAGITYSGDSWAMDYGDPDADVFFFGGSTMRAFNNGDSVDFDFIGLSLRPSVPLCPLILASHRMLALSVDPFSG